MNKIAVLKRKIELKKQHVNLINEEVRDIQILLVLYKIKEHLEAKIADSFNPVLSRKLDCVNYLIENN